MELNGFWYLPEEKQWSCQNANVSGGRVVPVRNGAGKWETQAPRWTRDVKIGWHRQIIEQFIKTPS